MDRLAAAFTCRPQEGLRSNRFPRDFQGGSTTMKKSAILLLTAVLALVSAAASAQAPTRVRGTIAGLEGNMLTVKSRDGTDIKVKLADNFGVSAAKAITLADIKQG